MASTSFQYGNGYLIRFTRSRVRALCGFQKNGSTFHGGAQSPLFKGVLGVWCARGRFTLLSHCFHRGAMAEG